MKCGYWEVKAGMKYECWEIKGREGTGWDEVCMLGSLKGKGKD